MSLDQGEPPSANPAEEVQHLKRVSRIKHAILEKYFPPWARILGSRNSKLVYVDSFAGPGQYEMDGKLVEGSAVIAVREGISLVSKRHVQSLDLYLVDDNPDQVARLRSRLEALQPYPANLKVETGSADSKVFVLDLLKKPGFIEPAFFLIDPYGHPLPLPIIRAILQRRSTEVLINLMWFQINRDLNNPQVESRLNELFGNTEWQAQPFMQQRGVEREKAFLSYFISRLGARYVQRFRIRYDAEDIRGTHPHRTKYYLLHASNHVKATLLMKEVMWPLGDEAGTFDFSGEAQAVLISETPGEHELRETLLRRFKGKTVNFDQLCEQTWELPFIPSHYRNTLRSMEGTEITVTRVTSKKTGIKGMDRIHFK